MLAILFRAGGASDIATGTAVFSFSATGISATKVPAKFYAGYDYPAFGSYNGPWEGVEALEAWKEAEKKRRRREEEEVLLFL